jgi:uncharacterized protein
MIKTPMLMKVESMVKDILSQDKTGHGFDHIQRVLDLSMSFAKGQPIDEELVSLVALLHDVDDYKFVGIENATLYKNARSIMRKCGVHDSLQTKVISNIQRIGYSRCIEGIRPITLEGQIVSDADMCDAIGATGLIRVTTYGLAKGQPYFLPNVFPQPSKDADAYRKNGSNHTINHFFDKLLKIKSLMMTDIGKKEAILRHQFLVNFLEQFFKEEKADAWLPILNNFR